MAILIILAYSKKILFFKSRKVLVKTQPFREPAFCLGTVTYTRTINRLSFKGNQRPLFNLSHIKVSTVWEKNQQQTTNQPKHTNSPPPPPLPPPIMKTQEGSNRKQHFALSGRFLCSCRVHKSEEISFPCDRRQTFTNINPPLPDTQGSMHFHLLLLSQTRIWINSDSRPSSEGAG